MASRMTMIEDIMLSSRGEHMPSSVETCIDHPLPQGGRPRGRDMTCPTPIDPSTGRQGACPQVTATAWHMPTI